MKTRLKPLFLILFAVVLLAPQPALSGSFGEFCSRLLKLTTRDQAYIEQRAKEHLPGLKEKNSKTWAERYSITPESLVGLSHEQAAQILKDFREANTGKPLVPSNQRFAIFKVAGGHKIIVKKNNTRSEMGEGKVYHTHAQSRWEAVAHAVDRFLGTNLVPSALALDANLTAVLVVPAGHAKYSKAAADPANLLDMTHVRLLDLIIRNGDREFPGNLLEAESGKLVAIDFDLSKPSGGMPNEAAVFGLTAHKVLIEPTVKIGKHGELPGVFSKKVVENLTRFNRAKLEEITEAVGVKLSESELVAMVDAARAARVAIEKWQAEYGVDLITPID